jgi:superfamily II DNA or RNA helicase
LFGEGFDLPAIEVVSFARPTESFALFSQQFGRALRLMLTREELVGYDLLTDAGRKAAIFTRHSAR